MFGQNPYGGPCVRPPARSVGADIVSALRFTGGNSGRDKLCPYFFFPATLIVPFSRGWRVQE